MSESWSPDDIRKEMIKIIEDIKKNTSWEPKRNIEDLILEIGDAPEYGENFGIIRSINKIIFGKWLDKVEPNSVRNHFLEFLSIRESFGLFILDRIENNEKNQLINLYLNILALSYLQTKNPETAREIKFYPIQGRFLYHPDKISQNEKILYDKIASFILILNQEISYKNLLNIFNNFLEDFSPEDFDSEEIIDDIIRYFSNDPNEIASPIRLKKSTEQVLTALTDLGHKASTTDIAEYLSVNQSTITRQIAKLTVKLNAKWRIEKNFAKMGLISYILITKFTLANQNYMELIEKELLKIDYFDKFFVGRNKDYFFQYTVVHCPILIADKINKKLEAYKKKGLILSFRFEKIENRIFHTCISESPIKLSSSNFIKILNDSTIKRLTLWNTNHHKDTSEIFFDIKDENLLGFISVIITQSISQYGLFRGHLKDFIEFLEKNGLDPNNNPEWLAFINNLKNRALEMNLIDFRLNLSTTGLSTSGLMIIEISSKLDNKLTEFLEKLSIFSWSLIISTLNKTYFMLMGPDWDDSLFKTINEYVKKNDFNFESFSVNQKIFRNVKYYKLYDYYSSKWLLN